VKGGPLNPRGKTVVFIPLIRGFTELWEQKSRYGESAKAATLCRGWRRTQSDSGQMSEGLGSRTGTGQWPPAGAL